MKKPNLTNCSIEELWRYVAHHLEMNNIESVLVGGAVVAIYTEGLYQSSDLDIVPDEFQRSNIDEALAKIGFLPTKSRYYKHPECEHLFLEFPKGPVELGNEYPIIPDEVAHAGQTLKILSPTSCVKDRLAGYIYWKSRDYFDQAVLVCARKSERIDWNSLRVWCESENREQVYEELLEAVEAIL